MAWFDRLRGELTIPLARQRLDKAVDGAGLLGILAAACGRGGLRRFLVRFEERGGRLRIVGVDAEQLPKGGGPPNPHAFELNAGALERALAALRARMPPPFTFTQGLVGVVRDGAGQIELHLLFDEDAEDFRLSSLPVPSGNPLAVEDPAYLRALAAWESRVAPVRGRWVLARPDESWTFESGVLRLTGSGGTRALRAAPLATFKPRTGVFAWLLDRPAGEEAPFVERELELELPSASELVVFAAARLGHAGVFQGEVEGDVPTLLFAGVRE